MSVIDQGWHFRGSLGRGFDQFRDGQRVLMGFWRHAHTLPNFVTNQNADFHRLPAIPNFRPGHKTDFQASYNRHKAILCCPDIDSVPNIRPRETPHPLRGLFFTP